MSNKRYSFQSTWNINAPRETVWQVLTATPFSWSDWWPQLNDARDMRITDGFVGSSFDCTWQAPIGYRLRSHITIGEVTELERVTLHSSGDLVGTVTCMMSEEAGKTRIDIDWQVETTKAWMNYMTFVLRPFFIWSHHAVMRGGERGLQRFIKHSH